MRIAVLSDIHGNLPALEAVIVDVERRSPDAIWCGGDIAWGGPWAHECIARVREEGWTTVRGNTDVWITGDPQTITSPEQRRDFERIAEAHAISTEDAQWLVNLPLGHAGPASVLLVHGTPETPFAAPEPDAPAGDFQPFEGQAGLIVYGHVHHAFVRRLREGTLVANSGAVGLPKDGDTACYLMIDQNGPDVMLEHRRISFDIDAAVASAKEIGGLVADRFVEHMHDLR